jgi:NADPH:quinone reductase
MMRAIVCREYGSPEDLAVEDIADPVPGPGEVLVRIHAAAVNFPDVLLISGQYQVRIPVPFIPGSELAGEVVTADAGAAFNPGDRVFGSTFVGAFAELVVLNSDRIELIPDGIDYAEAAGFGVVYRTAYHALRSIANVSEGDWVVILGAAGGVGLAAVDLAHLMKAKVVAAASSAEKLQLCADRGAEATVNYQQEDLKARIREITGGQGARAVIDPVGGPYSEPALRALGRGGTFVTLGYAAGQIPSISLNLIMLKAITVRGMEIRTFATDYPDLAARDRRELDQLFAEGRVRPHVDTRFPLADSAKALRHVADRKALGKVIIDVAR